MTWPTNYFPINLAFPTRDLTRARPEEGALDLVDALEDGWWDDERSEVVNGLRGDNRLHTCPTANRGDVHTLPGNKLGRNLVLKMLKIHTPKLPNR